jgi:hypothetical protein
MMSALFDVALDIIRAKVPDLRCHDAYVTAQSSPAQRLLGFDHAKIKAGKWHGPENSEGYVMNALRK